MKKEQRQADTEEMEGGEEESKVWREKGQYEMNDKQRRGKTRKLEKDQEGRLTTKDK